LLAAPIREMVEIEVDLQDVAYRDAIPAYDATQGAPTMFGLQEDDWRRGVCTLDQLKAFHERCGVTEDVEMNRARIGMLETVEPARLMARQGARKRAVRQMAKAAQEVVAE
jgi:hypothetical protein